MSNDELLLKLFLQVAAILAVCRVSVYIGGRFLGQSAVVCEMVAGVLLGPSLLGLVAPEFQSWLFPKGPPSLHPSGSILFAFSHIGLVLYMFLIGLELDLVLLKKQSRSAGVISAAGILAPFALGVAAGLYLSQGDSGLFDKSKSAWHAALFLGASMAVTSLPMMARLLKGRGLSQTNFGTLALAASAIDDLIAWCLLAVLLAAVKNSSRIAEVTLGGAVAYVAFILLLGRPLFRYFSHWTKRDGEVTPQTLSALLIILMLAAWFTDFVGIDSVFGAFVLGAAMPRGEFARQVAHRLEYVTGALLLPLFFAYSGLNTELGLLHGPGLWAITALLVLLAIVGKGVACSLAARAAGENWRESAAVGALMNARGLMELIILNIGLHQGLITPTLFTMMVLMALLTTVMCSPLLSLLGYRENRR